MKSIFTLIILFSLNAFPIVQTGDILKSEQWNSSVNGLGDVKMSILDELTFQSRFGDCWIQMNKSITISGTDLSSHTSIASIPDASGRFFRNSGGKAAPLGQTQLDQFQSHKHQQSGSSVNSSSGYFPWGSYDPPGATYEPTNDGEGAERIGNTSPPVTEGSNGSPRVGDETRPTNITINYFLRVSDSCN